MSGTPDRWLTGKQFTQMHEDLHYLESQGALAGVAEIIRERRHQIEQGHTPEHDREHRQQGTLVYMAGGQAEKCRYRRMEGLADPAGDERAMAKAGSLAAAEIDRLQAEFGDGS
jgi:hypothetical protein